MFPTTDQTNTSHSSDYRGLRSRTTSQYRKWISETLHRPRHWSRSQLLIALSISITWILSPTPQITFYITMHSWNSSMLMSSTYSEQEDQKSRYFWNDPLLFWEQSTRPGLVIDVVNLRSYFYSIMSLYCRCVGCIQKCFSLLQAIKVRASQHDPQVLDNKLFQLDHFVVSEW